MPPPPLSPFFCSLPARAFDLIADVLAILLVDAGMLTALLADADMLSGAEVHGAVADDMKEAADAVLLAHAGWWCSPLLHMLQADADC
eukprot:1146781-Pelagomonas_calceolata.AAC.10